jgi:hypothetical protein
MGFPFFCFFLELFLFSALSWLLLLAPKSRALLSEQTALGRRSRQISRFLLSPEIRASFVLSLFLFSTLMVIGAALLFWLALGFNWSALVLGCLSLALGLGILRLCLRQTQYPRRES